MQCFKNRIPLRTTLTYNIWFQKEKKFPKNQQNIFYGAHNIHYTYTQCIHNQRYKPIKINPPNMNLWLLVKGTCLIYITKHYTFIVMSNYNKHVALLRTIKRQI